MLSIYAPTKYHEFLNTIISKEERLHELVHVIDYLEQRPIPSADNLLIKQDEIWPLLDWYNVLPPFVFSESIELDEHNLLGLIFAKLANYEKAAHYLEEHNPSLYLEIDFINRLQQGIPIHPQELVGKYGYFEEYRLLHNQAIVRHYNADSQHFDLDQLAYFYLEALQAAPSDEYRAFTARQFASLMTDLGELKNALHLLNSLDGAEL